MTTEAAQTRHIAIHTIARLNGLGLRQRTGQHNVVHRQREAPLVDLVHRPNQRFKRMAP